MTRRAAGLLAAWTLGAWAAFAPNCGNAEEAASTPVRAEAARLMNELMTGTGQPIGGPFQLTDPDGRRVGPAQWRGKVVLMYFGYTGCPDACPTALADMAAAITALGADGDRVQPVFVTLDPLRDTPAVLAAYVRSFNPRLVALGGTEEEVRRVALSYKVFYEKVPIPGSRFYMIDHTSFTYVLNEAGQYVGYFPPATSGERIAAQMRAMLPAPERSQ
ncbi:SCO family protein [Variovorax sp. dw_954]|uniref:SCO family protein n=1 Tax=Variovorax sp. dw_954 TaxID=2720078 RepID=UPI001BD643B4|nr:SCO family protein [Variovorax sp. dw_954]